MKKGLGTVRILEQKAQEPARVRRMRGKALDPRIAEWIVAKVASIGFDAAVVDLSECVLVKCQVNPKELAIRSQLQSFLEDNLHHYTASWRTYFGIWAGALGNVIKVPTMQPIQVETPTTAPESGVFEAPPNIEHQTRPQSSEETGIVKTITVDGWSIDFRLPMLTRDGAEQARITLTELAKRLGYSDKSMLKRLAERHASELAEFGVSVTVTETRRVGVATQTITEPTYNPDQAAYLALSSETDAGRVCRVRILKAYKALLSIFEEAAARPQAIEPIDGMMRQLLANQTQLMGQILQSQNNLTALVAAQIASPRRIRRKSAPETQQAIPQAEQPDLPTQDPVRVREQDPATDRRVLLTMIKRLAGVVPAMPKVEYGARMSVAYHQIEEVLLEKYGHDYQAEIREACRTGKRINTLDWFEQKGIVRLVMGVVEDLHKAKADAKRDEKDDE